MLDPNLEGIDLYIEEPCGLTTSHGSRAPGWDSGGPPRQRPPASVPDPRRLRAPPGLISGRRSRPRGTRRLTATLSRCRRCAPPRNPPRLVLAGGDRAGRLRDGRPTPAYLASVATFDDMFELRARRAATSVYVCTNITCWLARRDGAPRRARGELPLDDEPDTMASVRAHVEAGTLERGLPTLDPPRCSCSASAIRCHRAHRSRARRSSAVP